MRLLRTHLMGLCLLACAAALYFGVLPFAQALQSRAAQAARGITHERAQTDQALHQLEKDVVSAQQLSGRMDAREVDRLLAPVDRLKVASELEHEAGAVHFQGFSYTLGPERRISIAVPDGSAQELTQSDITLAADARQDTDCYNFIDRVRALLPGRAQLQSLTIERSGDGPLAALNVHMTAHIAWTSSGTAKTMLGGL